MCEHAATGRTQRSARTSAGLGGASAGARARLMARQKKKFEGRRGSQEDFFKEAPVRRAAFHLIHHPSRQCYSSLTIAGLPWASSAGGALICIAGAAWFFLFIFN